MKLFCVSFFLTVFFSCQDPSANISMDNGEQVIKALIGKWESTHLETFSNRIEIPIEKAIVISYERGGAYEVRRKLGRKIAAGKWNYDSRTHQLKLLTKGNAYDQRVLNISDKELILSNYMFSNGQVVDSTIETYKKL